MGLKREAGGQKARQDSGRGGDLTLAGQRQESGRLQTKKIRARGADFWHQPVSRSAL
jgi:hypothetical protein